MTDGTMVILVAVGCLCVLGWARVRSADNNNGGNDMGNGEQMNCDDVLMAIRNGVNAGLATYEEALPMINRVRKKHGRGPVTIEDTKAYPVE